MSDTARLSGLRNLVQTEKTWLIDEWIREHNRILAASGRLAVPVNLRSECNAFLITLLNTVTWAPSPAFSNSQWSELENVLELISSRRIQDGFSAGQAATFIFSLHKPLVDLVRRRYAGQSSHAAIEFLSGAEGLLYQIATRMLDLYDYGSQEKAEQAVRSRDQLLAIVSHDLRNHLMQVLGTRAAYGDVTEPDAKQRLDDIVKRQGDAMQRLLSDLLDSAAISRGELSINRASADLELILNDMMELLARIAERKGIRIVKDIAAGIPFVQCDSVRIGQVLSNVLSNAIKFTPALGRIIVRLQKTDGAVQFSVTDNGPGIPAEDLPHLFERYWHGHAQAHGIGLGLTIVHAIVKAHGGNVWVESQLGKGTTVYFTLPGTRIH